jgi:RNA polymerase sigma-70 factor (ECF subfamily)
VKKFIEFYHKYQDKLFAYLMRNSGDYYLAGDIMQESFTRYLEKYGGENPTPQLIFTIARNALYDYTRKRIRQAKRLEHLDPADHDQEKKCIVRDEYQRVLAAMQKLDQDDRDILALAASEEFTYREIASVAGISEANVKVKVHRARTRLRNIIREGEVCKRI